MPIYSTLKRSFLEKKLFEQGYDFSPAKGSLYFVCNPHSDTTSQIELFSGSEDYAIFKAQLSVTIIELDKYCHDLNVQQTVTSLLEPYPIISVFQEFLMLLFSSYYDTLQGKLWAAAKPALEFLLEFIKSDEATTSFKKQLLQYLQENLLVCPDAVESHLHSIKGKIYAYSQGSLALLQKIKIDVLSQIIVFYLQQKSLYEGDEIHHINAYLNSVADKYGIPLSDDSIIPRLKINPSQYKAVETHIAQTLEPGLFIEALRSELTSRLSEVIATISENIQRLIAKNKLLYLDASKQSFSYLALHDLEIIADLEIKIAAWNDKYGSLCPITKDWLYEANEDEEGNITIIFNQENVILDPVLIEVVKQFGQQFLLPEMIPTCALRHNSQKLMVYHSFYWLEQEEGFGYSTFKDDIIDFLSKAETAPRSIIDVDEYLYCLNEVIAYAQNPQPLLKFPSIYDSTRNYIFSSDFFPLVFALLKTKMIKFKTLDDLISAYPSKGPNIAWYCSRERGGELFQIYLSNNFFSSEQLLAPPSLAMPNLPEANAIEMLILFKNYAAFEAVIRGEYIKQIPRLGAIVWKLAFNRRSLSIQLLVQHKHLKQHDLDFSQDNGHHQGENTALLLAISDDVETLGCLLKANLLTQRHLEHSPTTGPYIGINTVDMLIWKSQFTFLSELVQSHRLTQKQLAAKSINGNNALWNLSFAMCKGINTLQYIRFFNVLIHHHLITEEILACSPNHGNFKNCNTAWILASTPRGITILEGLLKKQLLTLRPLEQVSEGTLYPGANLVWLLVHRCHTKIFEELLDQNLITTTILEGHPDNRDSILIALCKQHCFGIIENLLSVELVSSRLINRQLIGLLVDNRQEQLLYILTKQNLLTTDHLPSSESINKAAELGYFEILEYWVKKGLIGHISNREMLIWHAAHQDAAEFMLALNEAKALTKSELTFINEELAHRKSAIAYLISNKRHILLASLLDREILDEQSICNASQQSDILSKIRPYRVQRTSSIPSQGGIYRVRRLPPLAKAPEKPIKINTLKR